MGSTSSPTTRQLIIIYTSIHLERGREKEREIEEERERERENIVREQKRGWLRRGREERDHMHTHTHTHTHTHMLTRTHMF